MDICAPRPVATSIEELAEGHEHRRSMQEFGSGRPPPIQRPIIRGETREGARVDDAMIRIAIFFVVALVATLPSFLIAKLYLHRKGIPSAEKGTIGTFMEVAPGPAKFGVVALNFLNFTVLCGAGMMGATALGL